MTYPRPRTAAIVALFGVLALAGCAQEPATPPTASATAAATPEAPATLIAGGSAQDNLPFFDQTNAATVAANPEAKGRDLIDALVGAGFEKSAMQVGRDTTTIGRAVDALEFSVKFGDNCLIGQYGEAVGGYNSTVQPALGNGSCLVGSTRPIDW